MSRKIEIFFAQKKKIITFLDKIYDPLYEYTPLYSPVYFNFYVENLKNVRVNEYLHVREVHEEKKSKKK